MFRNKIGPELGHTMGFVVIIVVIASINFRKWDLSFDINATELISIVAIVISTYLIFVTQKKLDVQNKLKDVENKLVHENLKTFLYERKLGLYNSIKRSTSPIIKMNYISRESLDDLNYKLAEGDFLMGNDVYKYCQKIYDTLEIYRMLFYTYNIIIEERKAKDKENDEYKENTVYSLYNLETIEDKDPSSDVLCILARTKHNDLEIHQQLGEARNRIIALRDELYENFKTHLTIKEIKQVELKDML